MTSSYGGLKSVKMLLLDTNCRILDQLISKLKDAVPSCINYNAWINVFSV